MTQRYRLIYGVLAGWLALAAALADGWETRPNPDWSGRAFGSAVWSGSELLVWGGEGPAGPVNDGWRYQPLTRVWQAMTTENAPAKRSQHQAAWTGRELLVWGGRGEPSGPTAPQGWARGDGGRYDPQVNRWQAMATVGAPSPRMGHASAWTGSEWVVWGGYAGAGWEGLQDAPANLGDGARYQPGSDRWVPMSVSGAPARRHGHTAVWTGSAMLVWGGRDETQAFDDGARYEPSADRWLPLATTNAPEGRFQHQALWTGSEMIVWGGRDKDGEPVFEGGRYDPASNTWRPLGLSSDLASLTLAPAAWTGGEWILWGGYDPVNGDWVANGARYDARWNQWTPLLTAGAPSQRWPMMAWTGQELLVLGGTDRAGLRTEMYAYVLPAVTNTVFQNHPPVLAAIADRTVEPEERLSFPVTATDPDLQAQQLNFSLAPDAPTGASVDPLTGRFDWTPSAAQAPSTNRITVRVTDGSLTDAKTFTVTVWGAARGAVRVVIEPAEAVAAGAQWAGTFLTPVWRGSGDTVTRVPVGDYLINFKSVAGWVSPTQRAITVRDGATNEVTARYTPEAGTLQVTLEPAEARSADAQWRRVGSTVWFNNAAIETAVPVGTYQVEFKVVSGWLTPSARTVTVAKNQATTATGTYGWIAGTVMVTLKPAEVVTNGARWRFQGTGLWRDSGVPVNGVPTNRYTIEFKEVAGWATPAAQTLTVSQNQTATLEAVYAWKAGSVRVVIEPAEAIAAGARWAGTFLTPVWRGSAETVTGVPAGDYLINFKSVPGWVSPTQRAITVLDGATNEVAARYTPETGTLQVTLEPAEARSAGAQWRRVGTTAWFNSAAIESEVPVGTNQVEFKAVSGWLTPSAKTVTVAKGQTTTVTGTYGWIAGTVVVTLRPAEAVTNGARWRFQGTGLWRESAVPVNGVPTNRYTIEFKEVAGWATPAAQMVTVLQSQTATLEAVYARQAGSVRVVIEPAEAIAAGARWAGTFFTPVWRGSAETVTGVPAGDYLINFKSVPGWVSPIQRAITVRDGATNEVTARYTPEAGALQVNLGPAAAVTAGAQWRRTGTTVWFSSATIESGVAAGSYNVEFKAVSGWVAPPSQSLTVQAGQTTSRLAEYLQPPTITTEPQSQAALVGADVSLSVVATGTLPLSYQWRFNGSPIAGATSATLRLNPVQTSQAGYYSVLLTNMAGSVTSASALLMLMQPAALAGTVTDALSGQPVAGVGVAAGSRSALTDAKGRYVLTNLTEGVLKADFDADVTSGNAPLTVHFVNLSTTTALTVTGHKTTYATYQNRRVRVVAGATNMLNFSMSPVLTQGTRVVLNWGPTPKDLDLHLQIEGTSHHVSFNDRNTPYGRLDHDETGGWGPETLTVDQFYPGSYHYYVEHYDVFMPGSRLTNSMAQVHIYRGAEELKAVSVPTAGNGAFWHVCAVDGETGAIRIINQITDSAALPVGGVVDPGGSAGGEGLAGVQFLWDFGDGTTSTDESPVKTYGLGGSYTVSLRVDGEKGQSDLKVKPEFLLVTGGSAPRLGAQWLGGGAVLSVSGVAGKTYRIESTPTLAAGAVWQTVATITLSQSVQTWTDGQSGSARTRFYRAVLVP